MFHKLSDIEAFRQARELNEMAYPILLKMSDRAFRDQMVRSSLSVPSNIAEGYHRMTQGDFIRFLRYARGSAGEFRIQAELAQTHNLISPDQAEPLIKKADYICILIFKLVRSLEDK
jgi:four helix bundle protein